MKRLGVLIGGVLVAVVDRGACGQAPPADQPAAPSAAPPTPGGPTDEAAAPFRAFVSQVKPDLEAITGAAFSAEVPIKIITCDELARMIQKPLAAEMKAAATKRGDGSPMSELEIGARAGSAAYKIATCTFGVYRYEDRTVYVVAQNARRFAKLHGWSAETEERVPRLALAHELVHALQDQRTGLGERLKKATGEEREALQAVIEGHAVWATDRLAAKLGWGTANSVLMGVVAGVRSTPEPSGVDKWPKPDRPLAGEPTPELYNEGRKFVDAQLAVQDAALVGNERMWRIVAHPPTTMAQVKDPGSFRPGK